MNLSRTYLVLALVVSSCSADTSGDGERVDPATGHVASDDSDASAGEAQLDGSRPRADAGLSADGAQLESPPLEPPASHDDAGAQTDDAGSQSSGDAGDGKSCGSRGLAACGAKQYCSFEPAAACGAADQGGVCKPRPTLCPDIFYGVCGCDGKTYANDCQAERAGVSVKAQGECGGVDPGPGPSPGKTCGGIAALECTSGFCNYEGASGLGCGNDYPDQAGVCQAASTICTQEYAPVCGCDHHSYGNTCEAHAAGTSVSSKLLCTELDCAAIDGEVVYGAGPAAKCEKGKVSAGAVRLSSGAMPIEGAICCIKP